MPFIENEHVYNVGFYANVMVQNEMYRKIHITPNEVFIGELLVETLFRPLTLIVKDQDCHLLRCGVPRTF
jgi:hypothetical protein